MSEHNDWDWEPKRRNVWDSKLLLVGGGTLGALILIGVVLFFMLERRAVENVQPPTVEVTPKPIEVQPHPFEPVPVFLLFACVVGIWLLVILVTILACLLWIRLPTRDDTREWPNKTGKPPPT